MAKQKYYAVVEGRKPGIYSEWFGTDGAEAQVKGIAHAVYKSFQSLTEAEAWYTRMAGSPSTNMRVSAKALERDEQTTDYYAIHQDSLAAGKIVIYTDGGCVGNPGAGGYGAVLLYRENRKELFGGFARTTNNRMELMACIAGLRALKQKSVIVLFCDSSYVVQGVEKGWARRWRDNEWMRSEDGQLKPVKNADLWGQLLEQVEYHDVSFVQVKGHAGSAENERCHQLSTQAMNKRDLPVDEGFEG